MDRAKGMTMDDDTLGAPVRRHYEARSGESDLVSEVARLLGSLSGDGAITAARLAGLDQFHVRGLAATAELAALADLRPDMTVLDAGSGLGGPSRYLAEVHGCGVAG